MKIIKCWPVVCCLWNCARREYPGAQPFLFSSFMNKLNVHDSSEKSKEIEWKKSSERTKGLPNTFDLSDLLPMFSVCNAFNGNHLK